MSEHRDGLGALRRWTELVPHNVYDANCPHHDSNPMIPGAVCARCGLEAALAAHEGVEPSTGEEPWAYAMETADGDWIDGENCIFGDRQSAQDEVDTRNDDLEPEEHVRLVPLYRAAALASQETPK